MSEYLEHIRPDEARFNDLPQNVMIKTEPEIVFETKLAGRCKRFDFLMPKATYTSIDFKAQLAAHSAELFLDLRYTAMTDRHVNNWSIQAAGDFDGRGFGTGMFGCVRELWANSFASLHSQAIAHPETSAVDATKSFSVFATEFPMLG